MMGTFIIYITSRLSLTMQICIFTHKIYILPRSTSDFYSYQAAIETFAFFVYS